MPTNTKVPSAIINKIKKLAQITKELYQGKDFNITRLTTLKSLCEAPDIAAHFVFFAFAAIFPPSLNLKSKQLTIAYHK